MEGKEEGSWVTLEPAPLPRGAVAVMLVSVGIDPLWRDRRLLLGCDFRVVRRSPERSVCRAATAVAGLCFRETAGIVGLTGSSRATAEGVELLSITLNKSAILMPDAAGMPPKSLQPPDVERDAII
jgi:hypothetical protein